MLLAIEFVNALHMLFAFTQARECVRVRQKIRKYEYYRLKLQLNAAFGFAFFFKLAKSYFSLSSKI